MKNKIKMYCYTFKDGLSSYKQIMFTKTPQDAHKVIKIVETEIEYEQTDRKSKSDKSTYKPLSTWQS